MDYVATGGESLCEVAAAHGFRDCRPIRDANPTFQDTEALRAGDTLTIPERQGNRFGRATASAHRFRRAMFPPPSVTFMIEEGYGYNANPASGGPIPLAMRAIHQHPTLDHERTELAITNYVSDRAGDGTVAGNLSDAFTHVQLSSNDPDHFKIQVYDNSTTNDTVQVNLYALKPAYDRRASGGDTFVTLRRDGYTRPSQANRKLENVECRRIPGTDYFRSRYLRLVSTETSRARRPLQCLLVGDYWGDGTDEFEKRYIEVLHQRVEAQYKLPSCPAHKCAALKQLGLNAELSLHMACYIVNGSGVTPAAVRQAIYKWTRAVFASAHIRPIIEELREVEFPRNILIIANATDSGRGRHASGRRNAVGAQSVMQYHIDGTEFNYNPSAGDSPETTADGIIAQITAGLSGYTARKFRHRRQGLVAVANQVSDPFDVLVFKADGTPAEVGATTYNDRPHHGVGGQSLHRLRPSDININNFPLGWVPATDQQRALRWNFSRDGAIPIYFLRGLQSGTMNPLGLGPYGDYGGWIADVGPSCYVARDGVTNYPFTIAHEIVHPLMHVCHVLNRPMKDAGGANTNTVELMATYVDNFDFHDGSKHIADRPIAAEYQIVDDNDNVHLLDGATPVAGGAATTPTERLRTVGLTHHMMIKRNQEPKLAPDLAGSP
ncbi:MAG: hypothetical protein ABFE13_15465 [Phycisphaerales bacterium]